MRVARPEDQSLDSSMRTHGWSLKLGTQHSSKKILRGVGGGWAWQAKACTRCQTFITGIRLECRQTLKVVLGPPIDVYFS